MDAIGSVEPASSRTIQAAGREIFVTELGEGPPLLMLHGGGPGASGLSNFSRNIPRLANRFRVIVPDMPGYGQSIQRPRPQGPVRRACTVDARPSRRARRREGPCPRQLARRGLRLAHGARGARARRPPRAARSRRDRYEPQAADRRPSPSARLLFRRGPDPGEIRDFSAQGPRLRRQRRCPRR